MKNIDIIVMGKTGAGKSTLINAILEESIAPTGMGQAITKKNEIFSKRMMLPIVNSGNGQYGFIGCQLNMYDTVGLEIDTTITNHTLSEIKHHIQLTKEKTSSDDMHLVWFCVNGRSSRFESYELALIKSLSIDYEIPFVIVLTQCLSDEEGPLERQIRQTLPQVALKHILAQDYSTRGGAIKAYGLPELLQLSVLNYKNLKVSLLAEKIRLLDDEWEKKINKISADGKKIVEKYSGQASGIGKIPRLCIPFVHGKCKKMINELNDLAGIGFYADDAFINTVVGIITSVFMAIPLLSAFVAEAYVETVGNDYLKAMLNIVRNSSEGDLKNNARMKERLKDELNKLNKET